VGRVASVPPGGGRRVTPRLANAPGQRARPGDIPCLLRAAGIGTVRHRLRGSPPPARRPPPAYRTSGRRLPESQHTLSADRELSHGTGSRGVVFLHLHHGADTLGKLPWLSRGTLLACRCLLLIWSGRRSHQTVAGPTQTPYNGDNPRRQKPPPRGGAGAQRGGLRPLRHAVGPHRRTGDDFPTVPPPAAGRAPARSWCVDRPVRPALGERADAAVHPPGARDCGRHAP
jgi:hypothetical protein